MIVAAADGSHRLIFSGNHYGNSWQLGGDFLRGDMPAT
jgi:hypothetical protein